MVQIGIVFGIDEKLGRGRMRISGARHGDAAHPVLEAVVGFIIDRRPRDFALHVGRQTTPLDHEILDHAVENGVVVKPVIDVLQEVFHRLGGPMGGQFQDNDPHAGVQLHAGAHRPDIARSCQQNDNRRDNQNLAQGILLQSVVNGRLPLVWRG